MKIMVPLVILSMAKAPYPPFGDGRTSKWVVEKRGGVGDDGGEVDKEEKEEEEDADGDEEEGDERGVVGDSTREG